MFCQNCGYSLWNLNEPRCPECGVDFDIRDYRFAFGSVAFACPHCEQLHEGAGEQYLPSESDFAVCQGCGQMMRVAGMRVVPLVDDVGGLVAYPNDRTPWEEKEALGLWNAWWQTCKMSMTQPSELGNRIREGGDFWAAYWFAVTIFLVAQIGQIINWLIMYGVLASVGALNSPGGPMNPFMGPGGSSDFATKFAFQFIGLPFVLIQPFFMAAFFAGPAHLMIRWSGEYRGSYLQTVRALMYGHGPYVLALIPLFNCGAFVGWIWTIVACILILSRSQRISGGRAALAVIVGPLLLLTVISIVMLVVVFIVMAVLSALGVI